MQRSYALFVQNRKLVFTYVAIAFVLFLVHSEHMGGQGIITGGISGTVVDQNAALIPGATITAVNDATGASLVGKANGEGTFLISNVPLGTYTVTISADGFGSSAVKHVQVVAGNATPIGKQALTLGTTSQTVEVTAGSAQLLNTETAQGEVVFDTQQLKACP